MKKHRGHMGDQVPASRDRFLDRHILGSDSNLKRVAVSFIGEIDLCVG